MKSYQKQKAIKYSETKKNPFWKDEYRQAIYAKVFQGKRGESSREEINAYHLEPGNAKTFPNKKMV
jgi:hypothetical protein